MVENQVFGRAGGVKPYFFIAQLLVLECPDLTVNKISSFLRGVKTGVLK